MVKQLYLVFWTYVIKRILFHFRPGGALYRKGLTKYPGNITTLLKDVHDESKEFFMYLMVLNPNKRPSASEAITHPFLRSRI